MRPIRGIRSIFATTENFFSGFMMHVSGKPRVIKFKGSPPLEMTPREYYVLTHAVLQGYAVGKEGGEWEISKGSTRFRMTEDCFSYALFDSGLLSHYGSIDFKGKTVLDVGGYIGDTAVLFHSLGAKRLVIYEPVEEHLPLMMKNIGLNHIDAEVKGLGVGASKGSQEVHYSALDLRFGREKPGDPGTKTRTIPLEDIRTVVLESRADIAKFNCETCERAILSLDEEVLRKIPLYVVETHGRDLDADLLEKFRRAGFGVIKTTKTEAFHPLHTLARA
jgi:FkbM family methyltransferase